MTPDAEPRPDTDERLRRYAELAVRVGANVQPGQEVVVICQVEHAPIARAVAREAYRAGATRVVVRYGDQHIRRAAIELGPEEMLGKTPEFLLDVGPLLAGDEAGADPAHGRRRARASRPTSTRSSSASRSRADLTAPSTCRSSPSA